MSTIIHPTWERDFIKGLRRRVLLKKQQQTKHKNTNKNENDKNDASSSLSSSSISSPSSSSNKQPYIVGLVGMPGSGKVRYVMILFAGKDAESFVVVAVAVVLSPPLFVSTSPFTHQL